MSTGTTAQLTFGKGTADEITYKRSFNYDGSEDFSEQLFKFFEWVRSLHPVD